MTVDPAVFFPIITSFLAVSGLGYGAFVLLSPERTARDRVADLTGNQEEDISLLDNSSVNSITTNLGALAQPVSEEERHLLQGQLQQAGFRGRNGPQVYNAIRAGLALALPALVYLLLHTQIATPIYLLFFIVLSSTVGYYGPSLYITNRIRRRQEALLKPFPDALDLLVSCVEAGLGVDAAFQRVAKEIDTAAPELSRELQQVNFEVSAGVPRIEALRHLDRRTGLREVNALVNVLTQSERFGTSVAHALRIHSELVRTKRMLAAEERAAQISPKLTVAMILFILPSLIIILIGPAIINVVRVLMPSLSGQ